MLMTKTWRWLPAAALLPLILAAYTGGPAPAGPRHRPGRAGGPAYRSHVELAAEAERIASVVEALLTERGTADDTGH